MERYPNFFVIGAMKCATSSLHEQLALQPGIFMTELKEPNFFSDDSQYEKGIDWYESLFSPRKTDILFGESSTHYTKLPTYPETIKRIKHCVPDNSNLKFIYVMRHPVDRLVSQYIHEWSQRNISTATDINTAIYKHPELISYSQYSMQLQPYFDAFGRDKVMPVFFERLIRNPQQELERICKFLGYSNNAIWHQDVEAQNVSHERMRKSEWRDFLVEMPVLKTIRKTMVPQSFRDRIKEFWTMSSRPQLTDKTLEHLQETFDQDLEIIGSWLGVNSLSCKNFKAVVISETPLEFFNSFVKEKS